METSSRVGVAVTGHAVTGVSDLPDYSHGRFSWEGHCWELVTDPDLDVALVRPGGSSAAQTRFAARLANILRLNVGNLVVTEGASINHLVALAIAGATADFQEAFIQNLRTTGAQIDEAVIGDLAANIITSGLFRTAAQGQRLEIDSNGLTMWGLDGDQTEYEMIRLGPSGDQLLTIGESTVSEDTIAAPSGQFEDLAIAGESLQEILDQLPRGIVAWQSMTRLSAWHGDTGTEAYRVSVSTTLSPGRLYRVQVASHYVQARSGTARVEEYIRYVEGTLSGRPGTSADQLISGRTFGVGTVATTVPALSGIYSTASRTEDLEITFMLQQRGYGTDVRYVGSDTVPLVMTVEDLGPARGESGTDWANVGTPASTATPPEAPPAKPEVKRYTRTWSPQGYGGDVSAGEIIQGKYGSYGNRSGSWTMPAGMRTALQGSTIEKLEVYLYAAHWYYGAGGTASIRATDGSGWKAWVGSAFTSAKWPRKAGRWVTVPSSWHAGFQNGTWKGIGVQTGSSSLTYYGRFTASATRFRATYRK